MRWWFRRKSRAAIYSPDSQAAPVVLVPESVYIATEQCLVSRRAHEEIAYWAGVETDRVWIVLTCVVPEAVTTSGSFDTTAQANAKIIAWAAAQKLSIIGQLHCHPGLLVSHSHKDDEGAFASYQYALSIVVPNYGVDGLENFRRCGVHRFDGSGFQRLKPAEVQRSLKVIPTMLDGRGSCANIS